jgi:hypothetical protein
MNIKSNKIDNINSNITCCIVLQSMEHLIIDRFNKSIIVIKAKISTKQYGRHYVGNEFKLQNWDDSKDHAWHGNSKDFIIWNNCKVRFYSYNKSSLNKLRRLFNLKYQLIFDVESNKLLSLINL